MTHMCHWHCGMVKVITHICVIGNRGFKEKIHACMMFFYGGDKNIKCVYQIMN